MKSKPTISTKLLSNGYEGLRDWNEEILLGGRLYGHPIARQLEEWWKKHYQQSSHPEWVDWTKVYTKIFLEKMEELSTEHSNEMDGQQVFGMSKAGGCLRASGLKRLGVIGEDDSGADNFTFFVGHAIEVAVAATMSLLYKCETQLPIELRASSGEPLMATKADMATKILGKPTLVSIKSSAYKMSGKRNGWQFIRRGFPSLPFEGIMASQPSWVAQSQIEMLASGYEQTLFLVGSKDIVKAFKDDEYLGHKGNGSLAFYAEIVHFDEKIANTIKEAYEELNISVKSGSPGRALYMTADPYQYVQLELASKVKGNIWGGPNQKLTGTFNPCGGCNLIGKCDERRD
jgi:hypothetical protein